MSKKSMAAPAGLVPHPRYRVRPYHLRALARQDLSHAGLRRVVKFPETAIAANTGCQRPALFPRPVYVDELRECRACHRLFLFFAREQKFWYETLDFPIDTVATQCVKCRQQVHVQRAKIARYAAGMQAANLSKTAVLALVDDAVDLVEAGVLRRVERLGALKNRALRLCGENARIARLARVTAELRRPHLEERGDDLAA